MGAQQDDGGPAAAAVQKIEGIESLEEAKLKGDQVVRVTFTLNDEVDQELQDAFPPIEELPDLIGITGEKLRDALPEVSAVLKRSLERLHNGLNAVLPEGTSLPRVDQGVFVDLPADKCGTDTIQVKLVPNADFELESFDIVNSS